MVNGVGEWANIDPDIRMTIKVMYDVLKMQGDRIRMLESWCKKYELDQQNNSNSSSTPSSLHGSSNSGSYDMYSRGSYMSVSGLSSKEKDVLSKLEKNVENMSIRVSDIERKVIVQEKDMMTLKQAVLDSPTFEDVVKKLDEDVFKIEQRKTDETIKHLSEMQSETLSHIKNASTKQEIEGSLLEIRSIIETKASKSDIERVEADLKRIMHDQGVKIDNVVNNYKVDQQKSSANPMSPPPPPPLALPTTLHQSQMQSKSMTTGIRPQDFIRLSESVDEVKLGIKEIYRLIDMELCLGRWIWKDGRSMPNVVWNVQLINFKPEVFVWKKDESDIICRRCGLYEIALGMFIEDEAPTVQLFINDELAFSSVDKKYKTMLNPKIANGHTRYSQLSFGNATGWTLHEYIALPENARISMKCETSHPEPYAQGFISLRKL